jgi:hypothetical protein
MVSKSMARGTSGAVSWALAKAADSKQLNKGQCARPALTAGPQSRLISRATTAPVWASSLGPGLSSMLSVWWFCRQKLATADKLGMPSPA